MALFDLEKFKKNLNTQWVAQSVLYFEELESTNTWLRMLPLEQISHGQLCLADFQVRGRGQYEREWVSEKGKNLTFTIALTPGQSGRFHVLTLACAYAAVLQIRETTGLKADIKWPNDVMAEGKKVGGLLTETVFCGNRLERLLIGIGLNVNQQTFPSGLEHRAASLRTLTGKELDRERFLCGLLGRVEYAYARWLKQSRELVKSINQNIQGYGSWVGLNINGQEAPRRYKLLGINEQGGLAVIDEEGGLNTFAYEQIRLRTD